MTTWILSVSPSTSEQDAEKGRQPDSFIWFILFIWLNQTNRINQMNQINQRNQTNQADQIYRRRRGSNMFLNT